LKSNQKLPRHIAFIMDGNGRWATKRLLPRNAGHKEGIKTMRTVTEHALKMGVPYLSFYAFSTENWNRPKEEVDGLISLIKKGLPEVAVEMKKRNVKLVFMGDTSVFGDARDIILQAKILTSDCDGGVVNIGLNYGGRAEIITAVNRAIAKGEPVNEATFSSNLYTAGLPDPDVIIRTGGEKRLSNFMLYQAAYAELFFLDTLWPDFSEADLSTILDEFGCRNRRFGGV